LSPDEGIPFKRNGSYEGIQPNGRKMAWRLEIQLGSNFDRTPRRFSRGSNAVHGDFDLFLFAPITFVHAVFIGVLLMILKGESVPPRDSS
jgi:hypothetical protein